MKFLEYILSVGIFLTYHSCTISSIRPIEPDKPEGPLNVIIFLVDDFGYMDLACYGSDIYETPHIDQLASEGMKFNQSYVAHPRCVPSRYALQTGRFPAREKVPGGGGLKPGVLTIGQAFKDGGYRTFFAGKWHLSNKDVFPEDAGYDINLTGGHAGAVHTHFYPYNIEGKDEKQVITGMEDGQPGDYLTDALTKKTVDFITANKDTMFFAILSHYAVHTPIEAKQEHIDYYSGKIASTDFGNLPEYIEEGSGVTKMRQDNPVYAGMIHSVDESLGSIMDALKELGIEKRTLILFTSDHGGLSNRGFNTRTLATSNYPLRAGKGWLYDGGVKIPTIVKYPGVVKPGSESESVIINTDYFPTLLEAAGLQTYPEAHVDGRSFLPVLQTGRPQAREDLYWHSPLGRPHSTGDSNSSAFMSGHYKLIEWYDEGRVELYNLREDFQEQNDLSESMPEKTREMLQQLRDWRAEVNAVIK